jgi:acetolactate synthase-1/2/3 large subunit
VLFRSLAALTAAVKPANHKAWVDSFAEHETREFNTVKKPELYPEIGAIKMGEVVNRITEATENKAVLVTDVGQNQMFATRYFKYSQPRSVVTSGGLGTMGFGIPAAIGAKLGAPERRVCLFCGDGGFQMSIQELGTIMQSKIGVKMILMNNSFLGMVRQWQELFWNKRYSFTEMANPDFSAIATAYGIRNRQVEKREDLDAAIADMLADDEAYLLVVKVEEEGKVYPMIPAGKSIDDLLVE